MTDDKPPPSFPSEYVVDCALDAWFEGRKVWRIRPNAWRVRLDMRRSIQAADRARAEEAKKRVRT